MFLHDLVYTFEMKRRLGSAKEQKRENANDREFRASSPPYVCIGSRRSHTGLLPGHSTLIIPARDCRLKAYFDKGA